MGTQENLNKQEAIDKMKDLIDDQNICMFCSGIDSFGLLNTRPMSVQKVDDDGTIWFFSNVNSEKNHEVQEDNRVQLIFSDTGKMQFLTLYGRTTEHHDQSKIDELWSPMVKAWFPEGKEDPNLTLLRFEPSDGYYWDTKNGKMVSFLKIAASTITGKGKDDGVEGLLNL